MIVGHTGGLGHLDRVVARAGHQHRVGGGDIVHVVQVHRVTGRHDQRVADLGHRLREGDVFTAFLEDIHPPRDDIEALGLEAGDQPAPLGYDGFDIVVSHLAEHAHHVGIDEAERLVAFARIGPGHLVGKADADGLASVDAVHQRTGKRRGGGQAEHHAGSGERFQKIRFHD